MKTIHKVLVVALTLIFVGCGGAGSSVTGYWKTATNSAGYLWLNLVENNGSVSGTTGVSTNASSLQVSGTHSANNLSVQTSATGGSLDYTGTVSGDTFNSTAKICAPTCTSVAIPFTRGTPPAAAASVQSNSSSQNLIQQIQNLLK